MARIRSIWVSTSASSSLTGSAASPSSSFISSTLPRITAKGLLISWATPAQSSPRAASFSLMSSCWRASVSIWICSSSSAVFCLRLWVRSATFCSSSSALRAICCWCASCLSSMASNWRPSWASSWSGSRASSPMRADCPACTCRTTLCIRSMGVKRSRALR